MPTAGKAEYQKLHDKHIVGTECPWDAGSSFIIRRSAASRQNQREGRQRCSRIGSNKDINAQINASHNIMRQGWYLQQAMLAPSNWTAISRRLKMKDNARKGNQPSAKKMKDNRTIVTAPEGDFERYMEHHLRRIELWDQGNQGNN